MHRLPILFFLIVGSVAGYIVYGSATDPNRTANVEVGSKAPDFTIKDEGGKQIRLSDYRGKLVLLNIFATWCGPCVEEMPGLEVLNEMFEGRQFQMLAVSVDTDWKTVDDFDKQYHLTFPTFLDPGEELYRLFKLTGVPETFLIDGNGTIIKHYILHPDWASPAAVKSIGNLIQQQETADSESVQ